MLAGPTPGFRKSPGEGISPDPPRGGVRGGGVGAGGPERRGPSRAGRGARTSWAHAETRRAAAAEPPRPSASLTSPSPLDLSTLRSPTSPTPPQVPVPPLRRDSLTSLPTLTAPGVAVRQPRLDPVPLTSSLSFLSSPARQLLSFFSLLTSRELSLIPITCTDKSDSCLFALNLHSSSQPIPRLPST